MNTKKKGTKEKPYIPEKKEVLFILKNIELEIKPPFCTSKSLKVRNVPFSFEGEKYIANICIFDAEEEDKIKRYSNEEW